MKHKGTIMWSLVWIATLAAAVSYVVLTTPTIESQSERVELPHMSPLAECIPETLHVLIEAHDNSTATFRYTFRHESGNWTTLYIELHTNGTVEVKADLKLKVEG